MVSDELKPKGFVLHVRRQSVKNLLLVNLGEEELKDYEIFKTGCIAQGRDYPKNKEVDNKRLNVNKVSTEWTELVDGTVAARVDLLDKVIPRRAIEDKLSKLVKTSIRVNGKIVHALVDSGTEITVIKKDLVPGISVEGASTIYLKGIFGPAVKMSFSICSNWSCYR
ncbi:CCHC-type domain-containing protein [Trichonephila clavipes]|nr:CCHC-type domain-containing protein [Trichonephila clavipes]